jgi:predicted Zn finger-like uncharacterized protein
MRLICPACKTVYEAPDSAITASGRMVRCSSCGAEWTARPPAPPRGAIAPLLRKTPADVREAPSQAAPPFGPEAERRAAAAPEAAGPGPAGDAAVGPRPRAPQPAAAASPVEARADALIRSLETEAAPQAASGGAFMAGFATVSLLALAAVAVYARQDDLARALPAIAGPLADYAAFVDQAREALADGVAGLRSGG